MMKNWECSLLMSKGNLQPFNYGIKRTFTSIFKILSSEIEKSNLSPKQIKGRFIKQEIKQHQGKVSMS